MMSQDFQEPPQKSSGMSVLMIVLIVVGVLFIGCAGICGVVGLGVYRGGQQVIDQATRIAELSEPYGAAVNQIEASQEVKDKYGEPILCGLPSREGEGELNRANANFTFSVEGSKARGTAKINASNLEGTWKLNSIQVESDDGAKIEISPEEQPPELQFDLPPEEPAESN